MSTLNLLEQHSKVANVIKTHYFEKLLNSLNSDVITEEFKELVMAKGVPMESLLSIIDDVPRNLFDVFDENKVYIEIIVDTDNSFWWKIGENKSSIGYKNRKEAEREAIVESFKLLEEKL